MTRGPWPDARMKQGNYFSASTRCWWFVVGALTLLLGGCPDDEKESSGGKDAGPAEPTHSMPSEAFLPKATGECPGFVKGDGCEEDAISLICTFQPDMVAKPRKVRIFVSDAADDKDGPIFVYWHGLGGSAQNVVQPSAGLGQQIVDEIKAMGGIVISPEKEDGRATSLMNLPWYQAAQGIGPDDDNFVVDDAIACVIDKFGADLSHIHVTGLSAGGLQTGQSIMRRSGYFASAAIYSGGMGGLPKLQDPDNKLAVAIFYGGENDVIGGLHFANNVPDMKKRLDKNKQFYVVCNHDMGHMVPPETARIGFDFMMDHPYGVTPEPYADGLPDSFPAYCE
jgi:predicted esterase